jgi:RHS repeat-associated protein
MDSLSYKYTAGTNKLKYVKDAASDIAAYDDIKQGQELNIDPSTGLVRDNYVYDKSGNLIQDKQEHLDIQWNPYGKIKHISKATGYIDFKYDPSGNRVCKIVNDGTTTTSTFYVRDAQGNTLATYSLTNASDMQTLSLEELNLYGSARLGVLSPNKTIYPTQSPSNTNSYITGRKSYEITNHLGNVMATISDVKTPVDLAPYGSTDYFIANTKTQQDYYPFGMPIPGRSFSASSGEMYKYGYQGSEKGNEVGGQGNNYTTYYRELDVRIGRWYSIDPERQPHMSPYCSMNNNPIVFNDIEGDRIIASKDEIRELKKRDDWKNIKRNYRGKWFSNGKIYEKSKFNLMVWDNGKNQSPSIKNAIIQDETIGGPDSRHNSHDYNYYLYYSKDNIIEKKSFLIGDIEIKNSHIPTSASEYTKNFSYIIGNAHSTGLLNKSSLRAYIGKSGSVISQSLIIDRLELRYDDTNPGNPAIYSFNINGNPWNLGLSGPNGNMAAATLGNRYYPMIGVGLHDKLTAKGVWNSLGGQVDACNGFLMRITVTTIKKNRK